MKWTFAVAFLAAKGLASPVPAPDVDAYRLRIISSEKSLNGQILTVQDGLIGVFKSVKAPTLEVYASPAARSDQVILHTYPTSDKVLALVGENDLLNLSTLEDPTVKGLRPNSTLDWSFSMDRRSPPTAEGRPDTSNHLMYTKRAGKWVAMPQGGKGDYVIKFRGTDGDSMIIAVDLPAQIVYERIEY